MNKDTIYTMRTYERFAIALLRRRPLLFVHQMGKVGSTAVVDSLRAFASMRRLTIYQTHFMTPQGAQFVENLEIKGYGSWEKVPARTRRFLIMSRVIGQILLDLKFAWLLPRPKVITLVRDPMATNLSGFFYNSHWWPNALREQAQNQSNGYLETLQAEFENIYPHSVPDNWFGLELQPLFDVDVYATDFCKKQGYQIYSSPKADVLLLKLETLNECIGPAMKEFLQINNFHIVKTNSADDKWYSTLYKDFQKSVSFSPEFVDQLYRSRYAQHFYSASELSSFRKRWITGNV